MTALYFGGKDLKQDIYASESRLLNWIWCNWNFKLNCLFYGLYAPSLPSVTSGLSFNSWPTFVLSNCYFAPIIIIIIIITTVIVITVYTVQYKCISVFLYCKYCTLLSLYVYSIQNGVVIWGWVAVGSRVVWFWQHIIPCGDRGQPDVSLDVEGSASHKHLLLQFRSPLIIIYDEGSTGKRSLNSLSAFAPKLSFWRQWHHREHLHRHVFRFWK